MQGKWEEEGGRDRFLRPAPPPHLPFTPQTNPHRTHPPHAPTTKEARGYAHR
jgi:hypothetical protein